ncbi:anthrax toxin-like adenylyl cyclase domain-containing protein [Fluviispira multicolorata]|uniref:Anthrax toxin edema factor central domain-containing protein n=1 Tax=Fluviispira multicolorata TaxID=2654512 RepID=A0A833N1E4_9BACT|nr:anthrax toxin-like adenylyl cyclase domain-containing protein [Fluviispira multicolorata]KAB8030755.1 hypothetical protein GCL57_07215 [Fluviispira multicolorata]
MNLNNKSVFMPKFSQLSLSQFPQLSIECGILIRDISGILDIALNENVIIMFRSTGAYARPWLEQGYPSKNFHIKGKTSDWGLHAGLVPFEGKYSKVWFDEIGAKKGSEENNNAIKEKYATMSPLIMSEQDLIKQLKNLRARGNSITEKFLRADKFGNRYFICSVSKSSRNKCFYFKLECILNNSLMKKYRVFISESIDKNFEQLFVMAYLVSNNNKNYITGDYDLFNICPLFSDYSLKDIPMEKRLNCIGTSNLSSPSFFRYRNNNEMHQKINQPNFPLNEHPHQGNITPRIQTIIEKLSKRLTKGNALPNTRIHHNTEAYNPFADILENCFPISYFLPKNIANLKSTRINDKVKYGYGWYGSVNNKNELIEFINFVFEKGYFFPINKKWNLESYFIRKYASNFIRKSSIFL